MRLLTTAGRTGSQTRDSVNGEQHEAAVAELRGMPSLPPEDFDQRVDRLRCERHHHAAAGTKRNQALRLDRMPRHESQSVALRDRGEQNRGFGHRESCSDADTAPAPEGKV
jgi:hypothetical protein